MPRPHSTIVHSGVEVEVEVIELGGGPQPVRVDMDQRRTAGKGRMRPRDHERRALHAPAHSQPGRDTSSQRCPPCSQRTGEHNEITRAQLRTQRAAELLHIGGRLDLSHTRLEHGTVVTVQPNGEPPAARCA